jgi:putative flippase GtrA
MPLPAPSSPPLAPQFLRYASAGAVGTGVHYTLLIALVQLAHVGAVAASTAGAIAGAIINYALNHRFTFASTRKHRIALPRFALVSVLGIALNGLVLAATLALLEPPYVIAQIVATGAVLAAGYLANRVWTF